MGMKTFGAFLAALFFISPLMVAVPVFAQNQPPSIADTIAKFQSKLDLTQDQVTAITPIIEKYSYRRKGLWESLAGGSIDKNKMSSVMKNLKTKEMEELGKVLNPQQLSQWGEIMDQSTAKMHSSNGGGQ